MPFDPTGTEGRTDLEGTRLAAQMCYCGDDCDCSQPRVFRLWPNKGEGHPWTYLELVWEGTFRSDTMSETREESIGRWRELLEAAERFKVDEKWWDPANLPKELGGTL